MMLKAKSNKKEESCNREGQQKTAYGVDNEIRITIVKIIIKFVVG